MGIHIRRIQNRFDRPRLPQTIHTPSCPVQVTRHAFFRHQMQKIGKPSSGVGREARSFPQSAPACVSFLSAGVLSPCLIAKTHQERTGHSQFMFVSANRKREAALHNRMVRRVARVLEGAGCQKRLVGRVERNRPKLLPVTDHGLFGQNLVQSDFALVANQHKPRAQGHDTRGYSRLVAGPLER